MNKKVEKNEWNPEKYLQFKSERTQPAVDLVSRINISQPRSIIDIGCGPGNSTQIQDYPKQKWMVANAENIINYNRMARFYFHLLDCSL